MNPNDQSESTILDAVSLADTVGFDLLSGGMGHDVESAIKIALEAGTVFSSGKDPLSIFRKTLAASIRDIETHPRGHLFQSFLEKGPYEREGAIPPELFGQRLTDKETASAIAFIYSFMVNSFKGALTELLAAKAMVKLVHELKEKGALLPQACLFVGDAVMVSRRPAKGFSKGADLYILIEGEGRAGEPVVAVAGVAEVKSGDKSEPSMQKQIDRHIQRCRRGLRVGDKEYSGETVLVGYGPGNDIIRITVQPDDWKVPRTFRFEAREYNRFLHVDSAGPKHDDDQIFSTAKNLWHVILKWSKEALAAAAYEMTFWYMEKVGETVYSGKRPLGWEEMSAAEAGRNAAKMMLYYAILRCQNAPDSQKAIALYNSYGFGYALGMNFINGKRKREMLWPEDLHEILAKGETRHGCRIR